jgi:hypothetical protein
MTFYENHQTYRVAVHENACNNTYIRQYTISFKVDTLNNRVKDNHILKVTTKE